ncbi:hypothetical protein I317_06231 [Kwoniella heveanensis CBS 569]|nr:hypothetical protein I317_06231 [Kwoniella heveanensis CBS 569]
MKISHPKSIFLSRTNVTNQNNNKRCTSTSGQKKNDFPISHRTTPPPARRPLLSSSAAKPRSQPDVYVSDSAASSQRTIRSDTTAPRLTPAAARADSTSVDRDRDRDARESLNDGLAICLFGYSVQAQTHPIQTATGETTPTASRTSANDPNSTRSRQKITPPNAQNFSFSFDNMFDASYEEEIRQQAVMAEVLPDAEMWAKWEKTEAPLRQGRGWYPRLDRHFLELLVTSEIHALSHPVHSTTPAGTADRIHRHATRVRRVACERIGAERLNAYCERVKEAFEAYMMGGWAQAQAQAHAGAGAGAHSLSHAQTHAQADARGAGSSSFLSGGNEAGENSTMTASGMESKPVDDDVRRELGDDDEGVDDIGEVSVDGLTSLESEIRTIENQERDRKTESESETEMERGKTLKREGNLNRAEKGPSPPLPVHVHHTHPATIHFAPAGTGSSSRSGTSRSIDAGRSSATAPGTVSAERASAPAHAQTTTQTQSDPQKQTTNIPSQDSRSYATTSNSKHHHETINPFGDDIDHDEKSVRRGTSCDEYGVDDLSDVELDEKENEGCEAGEQDSSTCRSRSQYQSVTGTASASTSARATRGSGMDIDIDIDIDDSELDLSLDRASAKRNAGTRPGQHGMDVDMSTSESNNKTETEEATYSNLVRHGHGHGYGHGHGGMGRSSVDRRNSGGLD